MFISLSTTIKGQKEDTRQSTSTRQVYVYFYENAGKENESRYKLSLSINDHKEEFEPDRHPSSYQYPEGVEEYEHGRLSACLERGYDVSQEWESGCAFSCHGPYRPCPCQHLYPCHDRHGGGVEGCENGRGRGHEKSGVEVRIAYRSARPRKEDSWPTAKS